MSRLELLTELRRLVARTEDPVESPTSLRRVRRRVRRLRQLINDPTPREVAVGIKPGRLSADDQRRVTDQEFLHRMRRILNP